MRTKIFAAVAVAVGAVCAGCTSGASGGGMPAAAAAPMPAADSFAAGACRTAADHVIALGELSGRLHGSTDIGAADRTALHDHQEALRGMLPKVTDAQVRAPLQQLVTSIGWARLRLDTRTYDPALLDAVAKADQDTRAVCVK